MPSAEARERCVVPLRLVVAVSYTFSLVFLILAIIGNINNDPVIRSTYFLNVNISDIILQSVPDVAFVNSIAETVGLHDFYQVGMWSYCEGYNGQGITSCSSPRLLYWFDPVEILLRELLKGATIVLPTDVVNVLHIVRTASHWMFASFMVGACLTFLCIFFAPMAFSHKPRWVHRAGRVFFRSLPITLLTFGAALFTTGASLIASVMFTIFRNKFQSISVLNIKAKLGKPMLVFIWVASGFNLIGFLMQLATCFGICCSPKRKSREKGHVRTTSDDLQEKGWGLSSYKMKIFGGRTKDYSRPNSTHV